MHQTSLAVLSRLFIILPLHHDKQTCGCNCRGLGSGTGTGAATAHLLAKEGYAIALIARGADSLKTLSDEINSAGGIATSFPIPSYKTADINAAFAQVSSHYQSQPIHVALYNTGHTVWKPFLNITPEDVEAVTETNIEGAFAFSKNVIQSFQANEIDEKGKRGWLIFTGATASLRGNISTSAFAAGKHAMRALS